MPPGTGAHDDLSWSENGLTWRAIPIAVARIRQHYGCKGWVMTPGLDRSHAYCFFGWGRFFGSGGAFGSGGSADAVGILIDAGGVLRQAADRSLSKFRMRSLDLLSCAAVPRTVIAEMPEVGIK